MIHINGRYGYIDFLDKNNKQYHRLNGPAYIEGDYQAWYQNGKYHREDGPAVIDINDQYWYQNGKRHRLDGPAVIHNNYKEWFIEGVEYTYYGYYKKLKEMGYYDLHYKK